MKNTKTRYCGHKGITNAKHESHMRSIQEELTFFKVYYKLLEGHRHHSTQPNHANQNN